MDKLQKQELWLYAFVWTLVFAVVPLSLFMHVVWGHDEHMAWNDILPIWGGMLPYLLLFILHNRLAAPLLGKKQYGWYFAVALVLIAAFIFWCLSSPAGPPEWDGQLPAGRRPAPPDGRRPVDPRYMKMVIGLLVVLVNLGVKAVFRNFRGEQALQALREQNLSRQMETLRYQINPHFFMNTLNNIHALVDVDPEKAKESIEAFSKLMRIVLYEGTAPTIPLRQELEYLRHYVSLMRLRYPDSVDIELRLAEDTGDAQVPPLLLATFVENAFKHGISYEATSFVHATVAREGDRILFKCANSRHGAGESGSGGLGLENMRQRLALLYKDAYTLHTEESQGVYEIILILPATL